MYKMDIVMLYCCTMTNKHSNNIQYLRSYGHIVIELTSYLPIYYLVRIFENKEISL